MTVDVMVVVFFQVKSIRMVTECALVERTSLHVCHRGDSADGVADQLHSPAGDGKSSTNRKVGPHVESTLVMCRVLEQLEL